MPSADERREVAEELRYKASHSLNGYSFQRAVEGIAFGGLEDRPWRQILNRLADLIEPEPINGETSDGYHTFNELYHHRALLFSVVVRNYPELCWKSKKHYAGDMYEGMFIVGINTPDGQASYHYDIEPYWDMFECEELEFAPEWDGHTPDQAIERIGKLTSHEPEERTCTFTDNWNDPDLPLPTCSACGWEAEETDCVCVIGGPTFEYGGKFCKECGAKVVE